MSRIVAVLAALAAVWAYWPKRRTEEIAEAARSTLDELADWTVEADRVLTF